MTSYPPPPPPPPGSPPPQEAEPPGSVLNAVRLMYAGAALSLVSFIAGLLTVGDIREQVKQSSPQLPESQVDMAVTIGIATIVLIGLIGAGLWVWMAVMNKRGRNWARVLASVLFGLNTLGLIFRMSSEQTAVDLVLGVVIWLVGLAAIIFLWRPESSTYFKASGATPAY